MKKAIFVDVDGTILDVAHGLENPSEKTAYAFKELRKNHYVFLCSGRSSATFPQSVYDLNSSGYICCNGQYIFYDGKEIYSKDINRQAVKEMYDFIHERKATMLRLYKDKVYHTTYEEEYFNKFKSGYNLKYAYAGEDNDYCASLIMPIFSKMKDSLDFEEKFKDVVDLRKHPKGLSYDVGEIGESKGKSIRFVLNYLGIDKKDAYSFGDEVNDIEMMTAVAHGVAMGSGNEKVKEVAESVCEGVLEDGFYHSLVRFGLIKPME